MAFGANLFLAKIINGPPTVEPLMFFRRDCIPRQRQRDCFPTMASVGKRGGAVVNLCWEESIGAKSTSAAQEFAYW
jgi:hypothetical protein